MNPKDMPTSRLVAIVARGGAVFGLGPSECAEVCRELDRRVPVRSDRDPAEINAALDAKGVK